MILLAPGAGAGSTSPWMQRWRERFAAFADVTAFDYPYRLAGRRSPDKPATLIAAHRAALDKARQGHAAQPVVLAGKSMGSRIGCHVALEEPVAALVCLGYPLKGAGPKGALRDAVLLELSRPILFAQGTRDPLCPLDVLEQVRRRMKAPSELHVVEGGNHSLEVSKTELKRSGQTQADVDAATLAVIQRFVARAMA
jgi:uncharacterized protein